MRFWSRYWSRLWDLARQREQSNEIPELASGREQMPPAAARRLLRQSEAAGSSGLRLAAAQRLQGIVGNRGLVKPGTGRPLPVATRAYLEASLGADLSSVRLHHDEAAAQAVNARAFAAGDQIVVGRASDAADMTLLGHEATHVAQAQKSGVREGISKRGGAAEHEARTAAQEIQTGGPSYVAQTGELMPAIQRLEQTAEAPAPVNPIVRRESVRLMLFLQYQQQGGQGAFALTPAVQSELQRLIPDLTVSEIARLWTPEPANPMEAFQRLMDAGHLPLFTAAPQPELMPPTPEPAAKPEPESPISPIGMGMVGLHFRLNPRLPPPISATIHQHLSSRGIPLNHRQVEALLAGRDRGVEQIRLILRNIVPGLNEEERTNLAQTIADALLDASLRGQLEREAPTAVERMEQQIEALEAAQGPLPELLERIPVGASITIYF